MPILKAPDVIAVSTTAVRVTLPATLTWYTIHNDSAGSLYYIADPDIVEGDLAATLTGSAADLKTLGASELTTQKDVSFFADAPWIDFVLPTGGASGNAYIDAGIRNGQVQILGRWGDGHTEVDQIQIDGSTLATETITDQHHHIHASEAFTASKSWTLPAGGSSNILLTVANTAKWPHLVFQSISDDVLTVNLYEAADYSGGTGLTAFNRNRNSSNTAGMALAFDATDDSGGKGTLIWTFKAGANKTVTASLGERFEFIFKQNTKYLLENVGSMNDIVTTLLDWYEHEDKHTE